MTGRGQSKRIVREAEPKICFGGNRRLILCVPGKSKRNFGKAQESIVAESLAREPR